MRDSQVVAGAAGGHAETSLRPVGASDITVRGSTPQAGGNVALHADRDVNLLAAQNTFTERSTNADNERATQLLADASQWAEGGAYRVAMHTVVGGLGGGIAGAAGAGISSVAAPNINQLQDGLRVGLEHAGVNADIANDLPPPAIPIS